MKFYTNINHLKEPFTSLILVNKFNKLDANYIPDNLFKIDKRYSNDSKYVKNEVKEAFEKLSSDAQKLNLSIICVSAYRSYDYQKELFNYYTDKYGEDYALMASAKPGHSEHQTGLSIDVMGSNMDYNLFVESIEYEWMKNNAHKYGFILRYPAGKELITGFKFEPWHYRYVGIDAAKIIYENNITLEEYLKKTH